MKPLIAILFALSLLLQTFNQVITVGAYYANKDYIAKKLCENRNKPAMHCEGKCCLKRRLAKESKEQAPSPKNQKSEITVVLFFPQPSITIPTSGSNVTAVRFYSYNDLRTASFIRPFFHPPTV